MYLKVLFSVFLGFSYLALAAAEDLRPLPTKGPALVRMPEAVMPISLQDTRILEPKAKVEFMISSDGEVLEVFCLSASHYQMAEQAEAIARRCQFRPAFENGVPIRSRSEFDMEFVYKRSEIFAKSGFDDMVDFTGSHPVGSKEQLVHCYPGELDEPLQIRQRPQVVIVTDEQGNAHYGEALVEGFVDAKGFFRFLSVARSENPYVAESALESLSGLAFFPPTKEGVRATSFVRIPFETKAPSE